MAQREIVSQRSRSSFFVICCHWKAPDINSNILSVSSYSFNPLIFFLFFLNRIIDVQDFVARSQRSCPPFILTTSLPFRELSDKDLSLEEADLANAVIVQRPLNTEAPFGHSWLGTALLLPTLTNTSILTAILMSFCFLISLPCCLCCI